MGFLYPNLLSGTATGDVSKWKIGKGWGGASITSDAVDGYQCIIHKAPAGWQLMYQPLPSNLAGKLVTLSGYAKITSKSDNTEEVLYGISNSNEYNGNTFEISNSWTMIGGTLTLSNTPMLSILTMPKPEGIDGTEATVAYRELMLVEGTTPAAWAPADGETLSGGGAQMSANLWSDSMASMQIRADGTYLAGKASGDLSSVVTGLASLTENQTIHMGASLKGAGAGVLKPYAEYKDAAGNTNWVGFPSWQPTDSWQRFEDTCVVPSGMTVCGVGFDNSASTGDIEVSSPVFCYGSTGIVMAAGSITIASITDVASTTRYYLLQSSTLTAPAAPTANPPGGSWQVTEPTYSESSTNSLYICDQTVFSDGTWSYSSVSLSTSYEAAKAAYNKASAASAAAAATNQHFWADASGAHVSSTGDHDTSGFHQLMSSVKNAFMHGTTELMTISENLIELGKNSTSAVIKFCGELAQISAKKWTWSGATRTGIDMHATYGTSISADTSVSLDASVEATQLASDGSAGGAINLNGKWLDLYSTDMFSAYQISMNDVATILDTALNSDVVLYNGGAALNYDTAPGSGTTGTVTLSESAANFSKLKIFFRTDDNAYQSVEVISPDGKSVELSVNHPGGSGQTSTVWIKGATVAISGTSITVSAYINMGVSAAGNTLAAGNVIYVVRVEGIR